MTIGSSAAQEQALKTEESANGKTRVVNGAMQYLSGNGWSKFSIVHSSFLLSSQVIYF